MFQNEILKNVLESIQRDPQNSAVVFDLDSTLFCVTPRTQAIVNDLLLNVDLKQKFPTEMQVLSNLQFYPTDWGLKQAMERTHLPLSQNFIKSVRQHWSRHFFSNQYLDFDIIYPGADLFVQTVKKLGAEVFYLTGRQLDLMYEGTVKNLNRFQFPLSTNRHLNMKPPGHSSDEDFKTLWFKSEHQKYKNFWFFENEPVIIEQVRVHTPSVKIVFVNSTHSGKAPAPQGLPSIGMEYR